MLQKELADALGISPAMVCKLAKRGTPVDSVERAQRWRKRHLEPGRVKGLGTQAAPQPGHMTEASTTAPAGSPAPSPAACDGPDTGTPEGDGPEGEDFLAARTRREVAEAHLAELKLAEQQGAVIQIEAVRAIWSRRVASTRDALLQIPSRLAPVVAAESNLDKVAELMETEIRQALAELSRVDA